MWETRDGWEGTGAHELRAEGCSFLHAPAGSCRVHTALKLFPATSAMLEGKSCFRHERASTSDHVKGRPGQRARETLACKTNSPSQSQPSLSSSLLPFIPLLLWCWELTI